MKKELTLTVFFHGEAKWLLRTQSVMRRDMVFPWAVILGSM